MIFYIYFYGCLTRSMKMKYSVSDQFQLEKKERVYNVDIMHRFYYFYKFYFKIVMDIYFLFIFQIVFSLYFVLILFIHFFILSQQ